MLGLLATVWACDPLVSLENLRSSAQQQDYLCVAKAPEAGWIAAAVDGEMDPDLRRRLSRALGLWLLQRADMSMDPALLQRLNPADRRLLEDGIHARRGRPTPAAEHRKVFENLSMPAPDPRYTDGRLHPVDLENLKKLRVAPSQAEALAAPVERPPEPVVPQPGWWSCNSSSSSSSWLLLPAFLLLRRRKPPDQ